jgi:hypothetical protein
MFRLPFAARRLKTESRHGIDLKNPFTMSKIRGSGEPLTADLPQISVLHHLDILVGAPANMPALPG